MKNKIVWTTVQRKVKDLIATEINPRKISDKQMSDLKKSLKRFNLAEIPAINLDGKILAGHQRIKALILLKRENEIIDIRVPNRLLDEKEAKQYLLSSNSIRGDWDFELLSQNFEKDFLLDIGFDSLDLAKIFENKNSLKNESFSVEKELQNIKIPKVKTGDHIILGRHHLICGDSTNPSIIKKLMGKEKTALVIQDPPFNISLNYNKGVGGKKSNKNYGGEINDSLSDKDYKSFIKSMISNALLVSSKDCHFAYYCDERYIWVLQTIYKELGIENRRVLVWIKNNSSPTPQVAFNKCMEYIVYGTKGSPFLANDYKNLNEVINEDLTNGNKLLDDISNLLLIKRLPSNKMDHPTEKSPLLHHKIIKRCSKVDDIIIDLTAGSGSLMVACEQLGRTAYMIEKTPIFCDLIIKRYESFTNKKAKIISNKNYEKK
ncbi:MAG: DNA modification methylase [Candidatus Nomurabacteria bacterium]